MPYWINKLTMIFGLILSFSVISKSENTAGQTNIGLIDRFYVGADVDCDYSTLLSAGIAASLSPNHTEILIAANKTYNENINLSQDNVLIDGGYDNCLDAKNGIHSVFNALILGVPGSLFASIRITGSFIVIKNIEVNNNIRGGIVANATSVITLENITFLFLGNSAIKVEGGGQINLTIKNSIFGVNSAPNGAGIYCSGNHSIAVDSSGFQSNSATGNGGAVYLSNGCDFSASDGYFTLNNSDGGGGAIYASASPLVLNRVVFGENRAVTSGGAITTSFNTISIINDTHFIRNESNGQVGGAIYTFASSLTLRSTNANCIDSIKCSLFDGNIASGSSGGAIFSEASNVDISQVYFENNRADKGTAIYSSMDQSLKIEGSIFTHNGNHAVGGFVDQNVIHARGSNTTITYSTFADNNALFGTLGLENLTNMSVYSSIVYDSSSGDVFDIEVGSTLDVNCLLVHETTSFDTSNAEVTIADPMFVDAANGDYHIDSAVSPAVDYCTDTQAIAQFQDIDFQDRGFDDGTIPNNPNTNGTYDIGADETYSNDIIFSDGFE